MSGMDLREELKAWEKTFVAQHGHKPGRADIKAEPDIAAKYREYDRRRREVQSPVKTPKPKSPSKTPRKDLSPTKQLLFGPTPQAIRSCLGPTPQKNGQILGLFDVASPVRVSPKSASPGRTPQSSGKRAFLDTFATPMKRRRIDDSPARTPAFLCPSPEDFKPKKGLARSLSSILQDLRKSEDAQHDAEWDILQEIEEDERRKETDVEHVEPDVVEETQLEAENIDPEPEGEMPLGPDTVEYSDESSQEDQVRKPWKKKGLKRQTKQVKMKPRPRANAETTDTTGTTTKARKINGNAMAHTNFCKLKIKSKAPKGKGRFGRRG